MSTATLFEVQPCTVCGGTEVPICYPIDFEYAGQKAGVELHDGMVGVGTCRACGHQMIQPVPTREFLSAFYASYMSDAKAGFYRDRSAPGVSASFRRRYEPSLKTLRTLASGRTRLLDVGSGLGMFLRLAREWGFDPVGVEPNREAALLVRERDHIETHDCFIEDFQPPHSFDVITMWDLLEHLADPVATLTRIHDMLEPGGVLALEIPARDSLLHNAVKLVHGVSGGRVRRPLYLVYGIHHLNYFTAPSITRLLEQCGFRVARIERTETDISLLRRRGRAAPLYNAAVSALFAAARVTRRQNKLVVFAQKNTAPHAGPPEPVTFAQRAE